MNHIVRVTVIHRCNTNILPVMNQHSIYTLDFTRYAIIQVVQQAMVFDSSPTRVNYLISHSRA